MAPVNLTTLANVKTWRNITDSSSDALITRLISAVSTNILDYLQRGPIASQVWTESLSGRGTGEILLRRWPVTSISSLVIDGASIQAAVSPQTLSAGTNYPTVGYFMDDIWEPPSPGQPQLLKLAGASFTPGRNNIFVRYTAGYLVSSEEQTPASPSNQATVSAPYGIWQADAGVVYMSTGAALTLVTGSPSVGQYSLGTSPGTYQFSAADAGQAMLISYSYVPAGLEQAAIETIAERLAYQGRVGIRSRAEGGQQTGSYFNEFLLPPHIMEMLQPYANVVPFGR